MNPLDNKITKGRKFEQVLAGACEVFLADGFEGASVDDIARVAGVSKATLYSYFPDKRSLFIEVLRTECQRQTNPASINIDTSQPAPVVMRAAAEHIVQFVLSDFAQGIHRICVAEAQRFPDLGREFYKSGPQAGIETISLYLTEAVARRELQIDDIELAAHQFSELCKAELFAKRVFGVREQFDQADIDRIADGAASMFMARYGVSDP